MNHHLERAMRYAQLTICEGDIGKFDPDRWLKYLDDIKCDGLVLGTGGYMAFHDTAIPYHYTVKHPQFDDLFGYMVAECRKKDYAIICRTDSHAIHEDAYQTHPEWAAVTADGLPRRHWSHKDVYVSCPLGDYGFDFMNKVHGELAAKYDMDAIFCNRWPGSGVCYCASCRENFRKYSGGREIPKILNPADETTRLYMKWHEERAFELCRTWDLEIQRNNPNMRFVPNSSVGTENFIDNKVLGDYAAVLYADYQGRGGNMTPWFNGRTAKQLHAVLGDKPVGGIFSTGTTERRWKDSVQEKAELETWVSEAVANGLRPWFTKFSVQVFDERWMPVVKNLYRKYYNWEKYLRHTESRAEVALMFSQQTVKKYALAEQERLVEKPINGWYHALLESGIPFDMIDSHYMDEEHLGKYKAVVLPNIAVLSDEDCKALKCYVENGGSVIADYETSLFDEEGNRRDDFGLAALFGVHATGKDTKNQLNAYITVKQGVGEAVMSDGFFVPTEDDLELEKACIENGMPEDSCGWTDYSWCADRRMCGTEYRTGITWNPADFEESPYQAVPAFPDLPMEEVYPRDVEADYEEVLFRKCGKGRVVYFCGDIGRCYWDYLLIDERRMMANSVRWALGEQDTVRVTTPGLVDVTLWENEEGLMVHLVNLTTVHAMRGPAETVLPLSDVTVEVRKDLLPSVKIKGLENEKVEITGESGEYVKITIPMLKLHEVIVFEK